ncbi:MAG TPA: hypothetical protein VMY99_03305 [Nevskiaceae bacterium]|nr:hypothetical protein [Nevskiaceae bacterium]
MENQPATPPSAVPNNVLPVQPTVPAAVVPPVTPAPLPVMPAPPATGVPVQQSVPVAPVIAAPAAPSQAIALGPITGTQALDMIFRVGFASIFLINTLVAWLSPNDFVHLLQNNPLVPVPSGISLTFLVHIAAFNDLAIGIFVLMGRWKKWVYAWAGAWFLVVTLTKIGHLF